MRRNAKHKPLIFVATIPIECNHLLHNENLKKFCEVLRRRRGVENYVWVREYTLAGRPHYHFVADAPRLDAVALSEYWSGLFNATAVNSIRLGTAPPSRKMFVDSPGMARYLTKYMGKGLSDEERDSGRRVRTFGMSEEVAAKSAPITYEATYTDTKEVRRDVFGSFNGTKYRIGDAVEVVTGYERHFTLCENSQGELLQVYGNIPDELRELDTTSYSWFCPNPEHKVYFGLPKKMQKARRE